MTYESDIKAKYINNDLKIFIVKESQKIFQGKVNENFSKNRFTKRNPAQV